MKKLFLLLLLASSYQLIACPSCNIHNYLSSSVYGSTQIFLAEVVGFSDYSKVQIKVISILKDDTAKFPFLDDYYIRGEDTIRSTLNKFPNMRNPNVIVGNIIDHHLYNAKEKIGNKYIFLNPVSSGVSFDLVYPSACREIELLISNDTISNDEDALTMLNGISFTSVLKAIDYFTPTDGQIVFNDLKQLIANAENDPSIEFGDFKVESHIRALYDIDAERYTDSISTLLSSIDYKKHLSHFKKSTPSQGKTIVGALTRYSIELNKRNPKFQKTLIIDLERLLRSEIDGAPVFAAYGLSFVRDKNLKKALSDLTENQEKQIALGLYWAGLYMRTWYDKESLEKIRPIIKELDPKLSNEIDERLKLPK